MTDLSGATPCSLIDCHQSTKLHNTTRSQDNVLNVVTNLQAGRSWIQFVAGARDFPLLQNVHSRIHWA
jgi:hypothetical protein